MTQHIEEARRIAGEWNLIDAIADALAAAEERGRIEERERIRLDLIVGLRNWIHARYGKWITFRSARIFADAITKEPTP